MRNPWSIYSQKIFMTKRCEIIFICRGVDHYYSWLCKFKCISSYTKNGKNNENTSYSALELTKVGLKTCEF
jgi:hypothetical protein